MVPWWGEAIAALLVLVYGFLAILTPKPKPADPREDVYFDPKSKSNTRFPSIHDEATVDLTFVLPAYNEEERFRNPCPFFSFFFSF